MAEPPNDIDRSNFQILGWTVERTQMLKRLWGTMSASRIADELGHGLTRNAVIGKAGRLGLASPSKPIRAEKPIPKKRKGRVGRLTGLNLLPVSAPGIVDLPPPVFVDLPADVSPCAVHLLQLRNDQCRWLIDDAAFLYCGDRCQHGPYCARHARISYRPHPDKRGHP